MDGNTFLTEDAAFQNLKKYFEEKGKDLNIHQLFVQDPERFNKYRYSMLIFKFSSVCVFCIVF